jgi:exonuclease VII small subunit
VIDAKLAEAQQPLQRLDQEQKKFQSEHNSTISLVSRKVQELNSAVDRLDNISAPIERSKLLNIMKKRCTDYVEISGTFGSERTAY